MRVESPLLRKLRQRFLSDDVVGPRRPARLRCTRIEYKWALSWKENLARIGNEERKKVEQTFVRLTFLRILYSRRTFHCERLSEIGKKINSKGERREEWLTWKRIHKFWGNNITNECAWKEGERDDAWFVKRLKRWGSKERSKLEFVLSLVASTTGWFDTWRVAK